MAKRKRKGYDWKPSTHRWVKSSRNKWLTKSSFWHPKKNKLKKSIQEGIPMSSNLSNLFNFLQKQNPELAGEMAERGLIFDKNKHRWVKKPENVTSTQPKPEQSQPLEEAPLRTQKVLDLVEFFVDNSQKFSNWESDFIVSVTGQLHKKGSLSDKQWEVIDKIQSKFKRLAAVESGDIKVDLSRFKKLNNLKDFTTDKNKEAITSMENQVKAGGTLSERQEEFLNIIEESASKRKAKKALLGKKK